VTQVDDHPEAASPPALPGSGAEPAEPAPVGPRRRRPRLVWVSLAIVIAAGAVVGVGLWAIDSSDDDAPATTAPPATATVERGTIVATETWDGTLERGSPFTVRAGFGGTVTRLLDQGAPVRRGDVLYRIDEQPVTLLSGVVPMYRDLGPGASGTDVAQLETNLAELGYPGITVDDQYTASTADAVRAWQEAIGAPVTGVVARGAAVFAPDGVQVDALRAAVGDVVAPGTPILDITGTDQVVQLDAEIDDLDRFAIGAPMTTTLPTGDQIAGTVTATEVVEVAPDPMSEDAATESIVQVEIDLNDNAADQLVGATVEVIVTMEERADVLLVPVNALLARAEGGYALEVVVDDGTSTLVPVETGLFAQGKVEVTSPDIAEGAVIGVAGR
jgi:peptidoglycan hydrolase-like protein with peptidoglycan-binding domain